MPSRLEQFRSQFPQYEDLSDDAVIDRLHVRHYRDMDREEFGARMTEETSEELNFAELEGVPDRDRSIGQRVTDFAYRAGELVPFADEVRTAGYALEDIARGGGVEGSWTRARERDDGARADADRNVEGIERVAADTAGLSASVLGPTAVFRGMNAAAGAPEAIRGGVGHLARFLGLTGSSAAPATAAGRVAQATAIGSGSGAVMGASEGRTTEERIDNARSGALGGAVAGGALSGAGEAVTGIARSAARMIPPRSASAARQRAAQRVSGRLADDGMTPDQAVTRVRQMQGDGVEASLLDTGPSARSTGRFITDTRGPGRDTMEEFVERRGHDIPRSVRQRVDDSFMVDRQGSIAPDVDFRGITPGEATEEALRRSVRSATSPVYEGIRGSIPTDNQSLRAVLQSPSGRRAIGDASEIVRDLRAAGRVDYDMPRFFDEAGDLIDQEIDIRVLHQIRQALDRVSDFDSPATANTRGPQALRGMLDDIMKESNPQLRAVDNYHSFLMDGFTGDQSGAAIGARFDTMSESQLRNWFENATEPQRFVARLYAANRFGGRVQNMANPTTQAREGSQRIEALRILFGDDQAADEFMRHIAAQREIARTQAAVVGGSSTAQRQAQMAAEDAAFVGETAADYLTTGGMITTLRANAARLVRRFSRAMSDAEREAVVDILTETDPRRLAGIFDELEQASSASANARQTQGAFQNTIAAGTAVAGASDEERPR